MKAEREHFFSAQFGYIACCSWSQIRVNTVNPTVVMTDMGRINWSDPQKSAAMINRIPLGKFAGQCRSAARLRSFSYPDLSPNWYHSHRYLVVCFVGFFCLFVCFEQSHDSGEWLWWNFWSIWRGHGNLTTPVLESCLLGQVECPYSIVLECDWWGA